MTRKEQIRQASIEYTIKDRPMCIGGGTFSEVVDEMNRNPAFEEGAKWADKTMIERACKWIENNKHLYKVLSFGSLSTDWDKFIREFRKVMEE